VGYSFGMKETFPNSILKIIAGNELFAPWCSKT